MEVSVKDKEQFQKSIEVSISSQEMKPYVTLAISALGKNLEVKGFRAGHVPESVVVQTVGEGKIWETAAEEVIQKSYVKILQEHRIQAIEAPRVEVLQLAPGNAFRYRATVAVLPQFELPDFRAIARQVHTKEKKEVVAEGKEVEQTLQGLARSRAKYRAVNRAAQKGDHVEVSFEGRVAGVKQEGLEGRRQPLILGEERFVKGFEEMLTGMKAQDEKDFALALPDNFHQKGVAGKTVDFHVKMDAVQEREIPAIDDDFAKQLGDFQSFAQLEKNVRDGIQQEKEKKEKDRRILLILERIAKNTAVFVPPVLIAQETEKMMEELEQQIAQMGLTLEGYFAQIKKTADEVRAGWVEKAKERVVVALVLRQIADKENIVVTDEEVETRTNQLIAPFKTPEDAEKAYGDPDDLRARIRGIIRNEKTTQLLEEAS